MSARIPVAVVGCGVMGERHARTVAANPDCRLVAVVDVDPARARMVAARYGAKAAADLPADVEAVIVATPATTHARIAERALAGGAWCLVEKPFVSHISAADALLASPFVHRIGVAHSERFNPVFADRAPRWRRAFDARRVAVPSPRARDVDVIFDLMIHDLDLALWAGPGDLRVEWATGTRSGGAWDEVTAGLRSTAGAEARFFASRRGVGVERRLVLDHTPCDLRTPPPGPDALTRQWSAFVEAIRGRAPFPVDAQTGVRAVSLAASVAASVEEVGLASAVIAEASTAR